MRYKKICKRRKDTIDSEDLQRVSSEVFVTVEDVTVYIDQLAQNAVHNKKLLYFRKIP